MPFRTRRLPRPPGPNRWKGFLLGVIGSAAGLAVMDVFWGGVERLEETASTGRDDAEPVGAGVQEPSAAGEAERDAGGSAETEGEEDATVRTARALHRHLGGVEPGEETARTLGTLVHYGYGAFMGGVYGAVRGRRRDLDPVGGLGWGALLWLAGDEVAVPALGLSEPPTERPLAEHGQELAAHLVFGAATAAAVQALWRIT